MKFIGLLGIWVLTANVWAVTPEVIYFTDDFDGLAPAGGHITLPQQAVPSNLVSTADQKWYKFNTDAALVTSDTDTAINFHVPTNSTGGAALRLGYIGSAAKSAYIALTNEVWERSSDYTLTVVHGLSHMDGTLTNASTATAVGSLRPQLVWVKLNGTLGFQPNAGVVNNNAFAWSNSVYSLSGADLSGGSDFPIVIRLIHNVANTADHWVFIDSVKLEKVRRYDVWAEGFSLTNSAAAYTNNPDGDILNNLYEYALGGDPTNSNDIGFGDAATHRVVDVGGTNYFEFVYPRREDFFAAELDYSTHLNDDLVDGNFAFEWHQVGVGNAEDGDGFSSEFDAVTNHIIMATNDTRFIKLNIFGP
jgi:hypothetical protein